MSNDRIWANWKTDACMTSTATAPIQKITQKESMSGSVGGLCVHTCMCVFPIGGVMSQPAFIISHRQIFLRHTQSLQRTFDSLKKIFFTQRNSGRHSPTVDPERHPWQHNHKSGRKVRLQQEEEDVPSQREVDVEAIVPACKHSESPDHIVWNMQWFNNDETDYTKHTQGLIYLTYNNFVSVLYYMIFLFYLPLLFHIVYLFILFSCCLVLWQHVVPLELIKRKVERRTQRENITNSVYSCNVIIMFY